MVKLSDLFGGNTTPPLPLPYFHAQDQKPLGTNAGDSVVGENIRTLNTPHKEFLPGASIAQGNDGVLLPEGVYYCEGYAPLRTTSTSDGNHSRCGIKDYEETDYLLVGPNFSIQNKNQNGVGIVSGRIEIVPGMTGIKLVQYVTVAKTSNGLGIAANRGNYEVYAELHIWKLDN